MPGRPGERIGARPVIIVVQPFGRPIPHLQNPGCCFDRLNPPCTGLSPYLVILLVPLCGYGRFIPVEGEAAEYKLRRVARWAPGAPLLELSFRSDRGPRRPIPLSRRRTVPGPSRSLVPFARHGAWA